MSPARPTLRSHLRRRWWVVLAAAALAALGAATASATRTQQHQRTIHFVLRPAASVSDSDFPGELDALKSDGSLVPTITGVIGGDGMLRRAAANARLPFSTAYSVAATVRPGSALIDSTVTAPSEAVVDRLAAGYTRAATAFVDQSYSAYVLDPVSTDSGVGGVGPSNGQVLILALLVGAALGVGLVAAELRFEPRLETIRARSGSPPGERSAEPAVNGGTRRPQPARRLLESLRAQPPRRAAEPEPRTAAEPGWDEEVPEVPFENRSPSETSGGSPAREKGTG